MEDLIHVEDILKMGGTTLRVTQPRMPCHKLDIRMDMREFKQRFRASGRTGFYAEVLQGGMVESGFSIGTSLSQISQASST